MAEVSGVVGQFAVLGLGERGVDALAKASELCKVMEESKEQCLAVHKRLSFVNEELEKIRDENVVRQKSVLAEYGEIVTRFLQLLRKQSKKRVLRRLASNRKAMDAIEELNEDIDDLYRLLNIVQVPGMVQWRYTWKADCKRLENLLLLSATTNQAIKSEIHRSSRYIEVLLAMLVFELKYKADHNTPEIRKAMKWVINKIAGTSTVGIPTVAEWFISLDDIEFDVKHPFDYGSYGNVYRGTFGKHSKVVIKSLLVEDEESMKFFYEELDVWKGLSNRNVIEMYGACHVGSPVFFVCEDAIYGNFADYFERDHEDKMQHKDQVWRLFYETALGLNYLHSQKVVHGNLKGSNILVGEQEIAKISDFGFSYIRSRSVGLSAKDQTDTIRWKAPECLCCMEDELDQEGNPRFASDVYSLGMCIIQAFLGEPPYAIEDDEMVLEYLLEGRPYPRPDGFEDDEWSLVQRMCDPEWMKRISLSRLSSTSSRCSRTARPSTTMRSKRTASARDVGAMCHLRVSTATTVASI